MRKSTSYNKGIIAEKTIADHLKNSGHQILANRHLTKSGEIDLIAKHDNMLLFVETKARSRKSSDGELTLRQAQRITNAASLYIAENPQYNNCDIRFDFALVDLPSYEFEYHQNYWQAN